MTDRRLTLLVEWLGDRWHALTNPPRAFAAFLRRLWRWIPILWRDADFDVCFLYDIMRHKIGCMHDHIKEHKRHTDWQRIVRDMKLAMMLLDRLSSGDFHSRGSYFCTCKEPTFSQDNDQVIKGHVTWTINMNTCQYCRFLGNKNAINAERLAEELLWKTMHKKSRRWWD